MYETIWLWLVSRGINTEIAGFLTNSLGLVVALIAGVVSYWLAMRLLLPALHRLVSGTQTPWDDVLHRHKVLSRLMHLAPALVIYALIPALFRGEASWIALLNNVVWLYTICIGLWVANSVLNALLDIFTSAGFARDFPITGFVQVIKMVLLAIAIVLVVAIIINKTALYVLGGVGALGAVLMLIFKDAILGLAAGLQLTANRLVARGDWIEMPKYDANGQVLEVGLTTVRVQNADKSITTIPTYSLISESFKNWRGMQEAGARRIKRALNVDLNSIRFCDEAMLEKFSQIQLLRPYIERKQTEIARYNSEHGIDPASPVNGRRQTNIGAFRAYVEAYLRNHPMINQDLSLVVRQLAPTPNGLPIELIAYCSDTNWVVYEGVQADIFDHILAVAAQFDLNVFQNPSGRDIQQLAGNQPLSTR